MAFYVGQKVVCVDDAPLDSRAIHVKKGEIYTISKIYPQFPSFELAEVLEYNNSFGYWASRFRPVVERKTDISIFTKMLTPNKRELARIHGE